MLRFTVIALLIAMLAAGPIHAEVPGAPRVLVLQPDSGRVLARVRVDRVLLEAPDRDPSAARYPEAVELDLGRRLPERPPPLPERVDGRRVAEGVVRHLTPGGNALAQVTFEGRPETCFVVLAPDGSPRWRLPETFRSGGAGASLWWTPSLAVDGPLALVGDEQGIRAYDLDAGKRRWASPLRLASVTDLRGVWVMPGALYVQGAEGLHRLDPQTGRVRWTVPDPPGRLRNVWQGSDGRLYAGGFDAPRALEGALREAVADPGRVTVVPYGTSCFALVQGRSNSVWEFVDGRWRRVFDFAPGLSQAQKDRLFATHGFSSWMRRRMESWL